MASNLILNHVFLDQKRQDKRLDKTGDTKTRSRQDHDKIKIGSRSRQVQGKTTSRTRQDQEKAKIRPRQDLEKTKSREIKTRPR